MCDPSDYPVTELVLVIDTDKYAGNFERQLCAYMTGYVGECGVGESLKELFCEEMGVKSPYHDFYKMEDYVGGRSDETGCFRPATIWASPDYWADSVGNEHPNDVPLDDPEVLRKFEETVTRTYADDGSRQERLEVGPYKTPAYTSVGIFLEKEPPEEIMNLWMDRAKVFCADPVSLDRYLPDKIHIYRVRLVRWVVTAREEELKKVEL